VPASDGIMFTQPLFSSFTKDGVFPPEEYFRYRPATVAYGGARGGGGGGGAYGNSERAGAFASAAAGGGGGGRPQTREDMRMQTIIGTPKAGSARGASRGYVRSGGFQLYELERALAD